MAREKRVINKPKKKRSFGNVFPNRIPKLTISMHIAALNIIGVKPMIPETRIGTCKIHPVITTEVVRITKREQTIAAKP